MGYCITESRFVNPEKTLPTPAIPFGCTQCGLPANRDRLHATSAGLASTARARRGSPFVTRTTCSWPSSPTRHRCRGAVRPGRRAILSRQGRLPEATVVPPQRAAIRVRNNRSHEATPAEQDCHPRKTYAFSRHTESLDHFTVGVFSGGNIAAPTTLPVPGSPRRPGRTASPRALPSPSRCTSIATGRPGLPCCRSLRGRLPANS